MTTQSYIERVTVPNTEAVQSLLGKLVVLAEECGAVDASSTISWVKDDDIYDDDTFVPEITMRVKIASQSD